MNGFEELVGRIHEVTGWTGEELEQATFAVSAIYADIVGRPDIGDHFVDRINEAQS